LPGRGHGLTGGKLQLQRHDLRRLDGQPKLLAGDGQGMLFRFLQIAGTLVGYRLPPFVKGINVPGYHLHFISKDHTTGGHVLGLTMASGLIQVDPCGRLELILPEDASQNKLDLNKDRTRELNQVER
jgi:acetolactate decarboxylase